ncbi:MAG: hypothetical protein PHO72_12600, partial [Sphaerochaeta sp.]|nr:hypothetical protein [Sphaerochaeta sp.]
YDVVCQTIANNLSEVYAKMVRCRPDVGLGALSPFVFVGNTKKGKPFIVKGLPIVPRRRLELPRV